MLYPITHTFRDGTNTYVAGEVRELSDEDAARFLTAGWLDAPTQQDTPTLDIHNGTQATTTEIL